jgi:hypothetical protein
MVVAAMAAVSVDVTKFGAVGDGNVDDTAAIRMAVANCNSKLRTVQPRGGTYMGTCPELYFPSGVYKVSGPISLNPYQTVRGDGSVIVQSSDSSQVFVMDGGYRNALIGIQIIGGSKQVVFTNSNIDMSYLTIRDCGFQGWSEQAVFAEGTVDDLHLSATMHIDRCTFDGPCGVYTHCDTTEISNCTILFRGSRIPNGSGWVTNKGTLRNTGEFAFGGSLGLTNNTMVPSQPIVPAEDGSSPKTVKAYWIVNEGSVLCRRVRFSGEGAGVPIVLHKAPINLRNPWAGSTIAFDGGCQLSCGQDGDSTAAIVTVSGGLPQSLRIESSKGLVSNKIPIIRVADGYDVAKDVATIKSKAAPSLPMYSITLSGDQFLYAPFPSILQQFVK